MCEQEIKSYFKDFNSHAHVERDNAVLGHMSNSDDFNSHAHVERDNAVLGHMSNSDDFNSHAHVERDQSIKIYFVYYTISTHTLTWSVTLNVLT